MTRGKKVSVVLPVYNEEENAAQITREIEQLFATLPYALEIVLVNDGSARETTDLLDGLAERSSQVGVIHLSRNFGHQAALSAGLDEATGDAVISMDADLQHPVSVLPELITRWENGADVVYTVRVRTNASVIKRFLAATFYALMSRLAKTPLEPGTADFRLLDRVAVDALRSMPERARFLRGLTAWIGFRQAAVTYEAGPRARGRPKYDMARMLKLALDGVISMSTVPLEAALVIGSTISILSFAYLVWVVYAHFFTNRTIVGWTSLIVAMLFMGGLQINLLGVLGLYVGKIYDEVKQRPLYLVHRRVGCVKRDS